MLINEVLNTIIISVKKVSSKIILVATIVVMFLLLSTFFNKVLAATYYVDGTSGDNSNDGSISSPWETISYAIDTISGGDTVIIREGLYRESSLWFGPAGIDFENKTTFKAADNERVVISRSDDLPTGVLIRDYVKLDGLWMGGTWDTDGSGGRFQPGGAPIGRGKEIVNCTLFGYYTGMNIGSAEHYLIQNNRFIHNGQGTFNHSLYLSGGNISGSQTQHIIIDNNIFVNGEGYGIHGWHRPKSSIITRNFIGAHSYGLVMGQEEAIHHIIANNFIWNTVDAVFGSHIPGDYMEYFNNVHGKDGSGIGTPWGDNVTIDNNAFFGTLNKGTNQYVFDDDDIPLQLNQTKTEIDNNLAAIDTAFDGTVQQIFENDNIDGYFENIENLSVSANGSLYQKGTSWFEGTTTIDHGHNVPGPQDEEEFWKAFEGLSLDHYDSSYQAITPATISNISTTPDEDSVSVSFTTNESGTTKVDYGLTSTYTDKYYSSSSTTNHSATISSLVPCTLYNYRVNTRDSDYLSTSSANDTFTTTNCTGNASIASNTTAAIQTSTGGSISLVSNSKGLTATAPIGYSSSDAIFQIKKLNSSSVIETTGSPTSRTLIGDHVYEATALTSVSNSISTFDNAISLKATYTAEDIEGYNESDLRIFRWNGTSWEETSNCSTNASDQTITCETTQFSTFGLFGVTESTWGQSDWASGDGQSSWSSIDKYYSSTNINNSTTGELTLTNVEEFTNTDFDTNYSSWYTSIDGTKSDADTFSGLRLWYVPDDETTYDNNDGVSSLTDLSGNSSNATQSTSSNQPAFTTLSTNNRSTLTFDSDDYLLHTGLGNLTTFELVIVARHNVTTNDYDTLAGHSNSYNNIVVQGGESGSAIYTSSQAVQELGGFQGTSNVSTTTFDASKFFIINLSVTKTGDYTGDVSIYINGDLKGSETGIYLSTGFFEHIGAQYLGYDDRYLNGNIAEYIYYDNATLTSSERDQLVTYLDNKYGVSVIPSHVGNFSYDGNGSALVEANSTGQFTQSINTENTNSYNFNGYVYSDGSAITSSDVELYQNNSTLSSTTYTSAGDGWYKISGTVTGANESQEYGIQIKSGKTLYFDAFSLNRYETSGTLTSSIFDTEGESTWGNLSYDSNTPSNTSIAIKVRSGNSSDLSDATDFSNCSEITNGTDISSNSCVNDGDRYIQYQATLTTTDTTVTPSLYNVEIDYSATTTQTSTSTIPTCKLDIKNNNLLDNNLLPQTLQFSAEDSTDDEEIDEYDWELQKDGVVIKDDFNEDDDDIKYTFTKPGKYEVAVKVIDNDGNKSTRCDKSFELTLGSSNEQSDSANIVTISTGNIGVNDKEETRRGQIEVEPDRAIEEIEKDTKEGYISRLLGLLDRLRNVSLSSNARRIILIAVLTIILETGLFVLYRRYKKH